MKSSYNHIVIVQYSIQKIISKSHTINRTLVDLIREEMKPVVSARLNESEIDHAMVAFKIKKIQKSGDKKVSRSILKVDFKNLLYNEYEEIVSDKIFRKIAQI